MQLSLSVSDVLLAAVLSFFLTYLVLFYIRLSKIFMLSAKTAEQSQDVTGVIEKCCGLFPNEIFVCGGQTVTRGTLIRIRTGKNKIIEGKFIGLNDDDVICLVTRRNIIAYKLNKMSNITVVEKG